MVAVFMITYKHEKYIAEAIESVLMQKTNFPFHIFLGEDCSPDNTRQICIDYANKYPDKITLLLTEKNSFVQNISNTYTACFNSGAKYMAMLEGDDYWSSPDKLQMQVDFLEKNDDFSFCVHNVNVRNEYTNSFDEKYEYEKEIITLEDAVGIVPMHASSLVYRIGYGLPKDFFKSVAGDDIMNCFLASKGKGFFMKQFMSVHRLSTAGTWSTLSAEQQLYRMLLTQIAIVTDYPVNLELQNKKIYDLFMTNKNNRKLFSKKYNAVQRGVIIKSVLSHISHRILRKLKLN